MVKILIAEDEDVLRMLVVDTLEDEGYEVVEACDGGEALQLFQQDTFDLVIVDYMMPNYTGIQVIEKIRSLPNGKEPIIIMLSAKSQQSDQDEALNVGADYFISKPFSPLELVNKINSLAGNNN